MLASEDRVNAKLLGLNDFHGNLNVRRIEGRPIGGTAVLAAYLNSEIAEAENRAIIVHAGDMVGASTLASGLLQDEPTITFLNMPEAALKPYCEKFAGIGKFVTSYLPAGWSHNPTNPNFPGQDFI